MERNAAVRSDEPFAAAQGETEVAVDDVFAEFTESTPEEVMALDDGSTESVAGDRSLEWFAFEVPERVGTVDQARDAGVGGPPLEELFGEYNR